MFAWSVEHFLIATTMLVVGVFSVLSWDSMFPGHRDVLVLGPLPIRAHTILLAKLAAVVTALSLAVVTLHAVSGIVWPLALNATARGHAVGALALTMEPAIPPVAAADLQLVLDRDLADAVNNGPLAPGAGGGVAIGVYERGVRRVFAYGAAAPDSVFPIASVTKPFTGLVLAKMVQEQVVRFDEPVRELIPAARLPQPPGSEITLLDLATHRSGLPPMPATFRPTDPANPFADFDVSKLYIYLATRGVGRPPAPRFRYSNLGFALLGHALSKRAGVDYATLVRDAITGPLGMDDTVVALTPSQRRRFLQGYNDDRQPIAEWDVGVLEGAGALRSTAPDMLTWLEANLHPERLRSSTLSAALVASHQVQGRLGSNAGVALDWIVNTESGDFQHGGAMAGFTADAFFNPRRDVAAIVLSNVGTGTWVSADVLGEHIRARLSGKPAVSIAEVAIPAGGGLRSGIRLLAAYWFTMIGAGVFIFGLAMSAQGLAASLLPRRHFLRVSSLLQLSAFCVLVGGVRASVVRGQTRRHSRGATGGTAVIIPVLLVPGSVSGTERFVSPRTAGAPCLGGPGTRRCRDGRCLCVVVLPHASADCGATGHHAIGDPRAMAAGLRGRATDRPGAVQCQDLVPQRSSPRDPRVLLGSGIRARHDLPEDSACPAAGGGLDRRGVARDQCAAARVEHCDDGVRGTGRAARLRHATGPAGELDLSHRARSRRTAVRGSTPACAPRRLGGPAWTASAVVFSWMWPWRPAVGHLVALSLLGMILVEVCLSGTQKIPFTCSYLPGQSRMHIAVYVALVMVLPVTIRAAEFERDALQDPVVYAAMLGVLGIVWVGVRWRTAWLGSVDGAQPEFEDDPAGRVLTLDVWDSRSVALSPQRYFHSGPPRGRPRGGLAL